jgi:hypothetical protein
MFRWQGAMLSQMSSAQGVGNWWGGSFPYSYLCPSNGFQTRGAAWCLRAKSEVAHYMPAADPMAQYWSDLMANEALGLTAYIADVATANAKVLGYYNELGLGIWDPAGEPWEDAYFGLSIGMEAWRNSWAGFGGFLTNFYAQNLVGMLDSTNGGTPGAGCLWTAGARFVQPFLGAVADDAHLQTNWTAVFTTSSLYNPVSGGGAWPNTWTTCPANLAPDPGGSTIDQPNSIVNARTAQLGVFSAWGGSAHAGSLYSSIRTIQYANSPALNFVQGGLSYPTWAIGPVGSPN